MLASAVMDRASIYSIQASPSYAIVNKVATVQQSAGLGSLGTHQKVLIAVRTILRSGSYLVTGITRRKRNPPQGKLQGIMMVLRVNGQRGAIFGGAVIILCLSYYFSKW